MRLDREGVHRPRGRQRERDPAHGRAGRARRGGLDLVGREGGAGDLPGLEEVRGGDQHFVGARRPRDAAVPAELRLGGGASELLILHLEVIVVRGAQPDRRRERRGREVVVRLPAVDDERVVDPELDALVRLSDARLEREHRGGEVEGVVEELEKTRPPHRERLLVGEGEVPEGARLLVAEALLHVLNVERHLLLDPRRDRLRELHVVIVGRVEPRALRERRVHLVVPLDGRRVGDLVARGQREEPRGGHHGRR
mmetsp:Transcript_47448/g.112945  ORF Transcript_47448/g.112945 Transcript_47448/m.112945 type:complete len:254 (+) Transcript_47448:7839-8600(+)